jgi:hypothetical protein
MPSRKCATNWLDTYLEYTAFQEAPKKFHLWTGLSTLASVVKRNVKLPRGYFDIYPNLYVALVAPSGFTKTSAADISIKLLKQVPDVELIEEKVTSWYILDYFTDLTTTKGECCVTMYAPEMKTFLGDLNKAELVAMLTSFYGCPSSSSFRTKGNKGAAIFNNICLNLLACSTPEWLTLGTTTDEIAGGFTGRFVYVFEDIPERSFAFPEDFMTPEVQSLKQPLIDDLNHIASLKGDFIITDQAKAEYLIWYSTRDQECTDERLKGYYARKRDLIFKLAMLLSVSQDDSLIIDEDILRMTWTILTNIESKMKAAFSGIVDDPALKYKDMIVSQLAKASGQEMTRAEILRKNWNKFDSQVLDRIITNLTDAGMLDTYSKKHGKGVVLMYKLIDTGY